MSPGLGFRGGDLQAAALAGSPDFWNACALPGGPAVGHQVPWRWQENNGCGLPGSLAV